MYLKKAKRTYNLDVTEISNFVRLTSMCTISSTKEKECFHKGWRLSLHPTTNAECDNCNLPITSRGNLKRT